MKMIKIFGLLLFAMFAFNACDDDDDDTINVSGTAWESVYYKLSNEGSDDEIYDTEEELTESGKHETLLFNSDGKFYVNTTEGKLTGTWVQNGSTITVTMEDNKIILTVSGDQIIRSASNFEYRYELVETL